MHTAACWTGDPADVMPGMIFALTDAELQSADDYEVADMVRVELTLMSGARAFAYLRGDRLDPATR